MPVEFMKLNSFRAGNPAYHRPWVNEKGEVKVTIMQNGKPANVTINRDPLMTVNTTLRKDEWITYDRAVKKVVAEKRTILDLLLGRGLVVDVNGMATTMYQQERMSDMDAAEVGMSPVVRGQRDRLTFDTVTTPLPFIFKDFQVTAR